MKGFILAHKKMLTTWLLYGFAIDLVSAKACADDIRQATTCTGWATSGECERNAPYMRDHCPMSCGWCGAGRGVSQAKEAASNPICADPSDSSCAPLTPEVLSCVDESPSCSSWAESDECSKNPVFMNKGCMASCYVCQSAGCLDTHASCRDWAAKGECVTNEEFMLATCSFSCRSCFLNQNAACRRDNEELPAAVVGTVDATFERLAKLDNVVVLSREPWVLHFTSFLREGEAEELIAAAGHTFERSRATGDDVHVAKLHTTCHTACPPTPLLYLGALLRRASLGSLPRDM